MEPLALVIENDGGTRRLLDVLLTRSGLEVDLAATGADALLLLEHVHYDVIFLPLPPPGTSAVQVLEWIAGARPALLAKTVVLSSAPERELERVQDAWPAVRIIRKPFELGEIVETAQRLAAGCAERSPSAFESFCRASVRAGARAGLIVRNAGGHVEVLHAFGYRPGEVDAYFPLPLETPVPLCATIRNAAPVWLASITTATAQYPLLKPVFERNESRALAAVPLLRGGRAFGAAGWSFREPRLFTEAERQELVEIAAALADRMADESDPPATAAGA